MDTQTMDSTWQSFLDDFSSTLDENTYYYDPFDDVENDFDDFFEPQYDRDDSSYCGAMTMERKIHLHHHGSSRPGNKRLRQRHAANLRERKRMKSINEAFDGLRMRVPASRMDKKISKVDTLKCAINYIHQLKDLLRASELQGRYGDKKQKVIIRCHQPEQHCADGSALPYAHSLSWTNERAIKYGPNKTLKAKIWIPEISTPENTTDSSTVNE